MGQLDTQPLMQTILAFINAETWVESQRIVEKYPELLTREADVQFEHWLKGKEDNEERRLIQEHRNILRNCRQFGIPETFAEKTGIPSQFQVDKRLADKAEERYFQYNDLDALNECLDAWKRILLHPSFPTVSEEFQARALNSVGIVFSYRYSTQGEPDDLNKAILLGRKIIEYISSDSPDLPMYLNNLAIRLHDRYNRMGTETDLEESIELTRESIKRTSPDSPDLPGRLNSLGAGLHIRYERTGMLSDLEELIQTFKRAIELIPANSPDLHGHLNNLGVALMERYERTGALTDLEKSIEILRQGIKLTSSGSPILPMHLNNLGVALSEYYKLTGTLDSLEESIGVKIRAVELTPPDSPDLPGRLSNLSVGFSDTYKLMQVRSHLEEAIEAVREAIKLTPPDSPDSPGRLNNLGDILRLLYEQTRSISDLEEAIKATREAIKLTPPDSPDLPGCLNTLAMGLMNRYDSTGDLKDLIEAKESYQTACQTGLDVKLATAVNASNNWGSWAWRRESWEEANTAYDYGVKAIERLFQIQIQRQHKETWLYKAQGLYTAAAYAYAKTEQLVQTVTTLEHGRAFLLSEVLERNRADLERLQDIGQTDLYDQYQTILNRLGVLEHQKATDIDPWREVRGELDVVIAKIQQLPGYEDFFHSATFEDDIVVAIRGSL